jgi:hypothetical protein
VGLLSAHLDDADFADVWGARAALGGAESGVSAEAHLSACQECRARFAAFNEWLDGLRIDAVTEADEMFPAERLAAQQAQILRRIEAAEHPARVLAFPRFTRPVSVQQTGRRRWVAAAAAAGLFVGVALGQMLEFRRFDSARPADTVVERQIPRGAPVLPSEATRMAVQPASSQDDDESLLLEFEPELTSSQARVPDSLQYLNAITPTARDYDPR